MTRMTGGQALVRSMQSEGIRVVFGLPGSGQYEIVDALWETPESRYISVRHEQATTYMAHGYAGAGGGIAGAVVLPGPGTFNALAGMSTAFDASSPMLVVTGAGIIRDHEQGDETDWLRPLGKWAARIDRPAEAPEVVHEAMRQMKTGRPGPVLLQVPSGTLADAEEVDLIEPEEYEQPAGDPDLIRRAAQLLLDSTAPVIWAGGGVHVSNASEALLAVAEHMQAPVVSSPNGKGAISDHHPLSLGLAELRYQPLGEWMSTRDVVLAVGTRARFDKRPRGQRVVRIDIDDDGIADRDQHDIGIAGDARASLGALLQAIRAAPPRTGDVAPEIASLLHERYADHNQLDPQRSFINAIREAVPDDGIVVQGMNQMGYYSRNYLPMYASRTYLTASNRGTLGHAFPVGLGAKIARPDRAVVVLSGDGGFLYNSQELATAVQYGVNVVAIVFNDNAYGNVLRAQIEEFDGHVLGTRLHNPDFAALAQTYGARGVRAEDAAELNAVLKEALSLDAPTLIEVPVGMMDRVY